MKKWQSAIVIMFCAGLLGLFSIETPAQADCASGTCSEPSYFDGAYFDGYYAVEQPRRSSKPKHKATTARKTKSSRSAKSQPRYVIQESPCSSGNCYADQPWW